jgi:hypothetical protein
VVTQGQGAEALEGLTGRADDALAAWSARPEGAGPYVLQTGNGEVAIERIEGREDGTLSYLEVWVRGGEADGWPHFRVVNPPTLAEDPEGDVVIQGRRFRLDPLAALAQAIGMNGGAQKVRRRTL